MQYVFVVLDEFHVLWELSYVVFDGTFTLEDLHRHGDFIVNVSEGS